MTLKFSLAGREQEAEFRRLVASSAMPGLPRLSYRREPDFWQGLNVQGERVQAMAFRSEGRLVGMGCRSLRRCLVNGRPRLFGYLSGLRLDPSVRKGFALARGYRFLRELHGDGLVPAYLSTVMDGNTDAEGALLSGRAGLPTYLPWGRFVVHALSPRRLKAGDLSGASGALRVLPGAKLGSRAIFEFLRTEGPRRQFYPCWRAEDLGTPLARGLTLGDFLVAERDGEVLGTIALWDQKAFRQLWVESYGVLGVLRPAINLGMAVLGVPALPRSGAAVDAVSAACVLCKGDDLAVFSALLDAALDRLAREGRHCLLFGLHEDDPLQRELSRRRTWTQSSKLFVVHWADGESFVAGLDRTRPPYLELATL